LVNGAVADENGVFTIANVTPGKYVLRVTNMGYQTLLSPTSKCSRRSQPARSWKYYNPARGTKAE
jgi:hypothetical protein